jgi:hypothetical protein
MAASQGGGGGGGGVACMVEATDKLWGFKLVRNSRRDAM